jgi:hypothetical protein
MYSISQPPDGGASLSVGAGVVAGSSAGGASGFWSVGADGGVSAGGGVSSTGGGAVSVGTGGSSTGLLQPASSAAPDNDNTSSAARNGAPMGLEFLVFMDSSSFREAGQGTACALPGNEEGRLAPPFPGGPVLGHRLKRLTIDCVHRLPGYLSMITCSTTYFSVFGSP